MGRVGAGTRIKVCPYPMDLHPTVQATWITT
jgi:hypothetical protein